MLRCINVSFASGLFIGFAVVLTTGAPSYSKYQIFLEELKTVGQETFPSFLGTTSKFDPVRTKAVESVAQVLREQMKDSSQAEIRKLSEHIIALSERYRFSPAFILSLIEVESRFRTDAVSHRGAVGLMQIMPETGATLAQRLAIKWEGEQSLRDPNTNITMGVHYMDELRQQFKSSKYYLAAYNQGPARVIRLIQEGVPVSMDYSDKVMQISRRYSGTAIGRL